jgi:hypothetical protein
MISLPSLPSLELSFRDFHEILEMPITTQYLGFEDLSHGILVDYAAADGAIDEVLEKYASA